MNFFHQVFRMMSGDRMSVELTMPMLSDRQGLASTAKAWGIKQVPYARLRCDVHTGTTLVSRYVIETNTVVHCRTMIFPSTIAQTDLAEHWTDAALYAYGIALKDAEFGLKPIIPAPADVYPSGVDSLRAMLLRSPKEHLRAAALSADPYDALAKHWGVSLQAAKDRVIAAFDVAGVERVEGGIKIIGPVWKEEEKTDLQKWAKFFGVPEECFVASPHGGTVRPVPPHVDRVVASMPDCDAPIAKAAQDTTGCHAYDKRDGAFLGVVVGDDGSAMIRAKKDALITTWPRSKLNFVSIRIGCSVFSLSTGRFLGTVTTDCGDHLCVRTIGGLIRSVSKRMVTIGGKPGDSSTSEEARATWPRSVWARGLAR